VTAALPHRYTEGELVRLLRQRHVRPGNGGAGEYAFLEQVRDAASFGATRTLDVVTLSLWPSRGMELHGYEVKVTRADWIRELRDPAKADIFFRRLDRFSLVVGDEHIVEPGELPPLWGLLAVRKGRLVTVVKAPNLGRSEEEQRVSRSWLVCLLRAAGAVPEVDPAEVAQARTEGVQAGRAMAEAQMAMLRRGIAREKELREEEAAARHAILEALGMSHRYVGLEELRAIAGAVRLALASQHELARARGRLTRIAQEAEECAQRLRSAVEAGA
jgi:hypothetical protein